MMTVQEVLAQLEALGNAKLREQNIKRGAGENQFGVKMGDIRTVAKKIKTDHALALELWETGNTDARQVAILIVNPKKLTYDEISHWVKSEKYTWVADWLHSYILKDRADKETLRQEWMQTDDTMAARAGWSLTAGSVARQPELVDIPALLNRIEKEMPTAAPEVQWTMNTTLANIGIHHAQYRERALAIGEKLGIYRDYPVSKGCTSPFAPIWIGEMVRRMG